MSAAELALAATLLLGVGLSLLAALGLQQFPDVFARMHAATKPVALGHLLVLGVAAVALSDQPRSVAKVVLVAVLQLITAPLGAHMVGRAAYRAGQLSPGTAVDELAEADLGVPD